MAVGRWKRALRDVEGERSKREGPSVRRVGWRSERWDRWVRIDCR